jgi:hypothetical protein
MNDTANPIFFKFWNENFTFKILQQLRIIKTSFFYFTRLYPFKKRTYIEECVLPKANYILWDGQGSLIDISWVDWAYNSSTCDVVMYCRQRRQLYYGGQIYKYYLPSTPPQLSLHRRAALSSNSNGTRGVYCRKNPKSSLYCEMSMRGPPWHMNNGPCVLWGQLSLYTVTRRRGKTRPHPSIRLNRRVPLHRRKKPGPSSLDRRRRFHLLPNKRWHLLLHFLSNEPGTAGPTQIASPIYTYRIITTDLYKV